MNYMPDDIVTTRDGKKHRVLWECKAGSKLYVKSTTPGGRAYMVKTSNVTHHQSKKDHK